MHISFGNNYIIMINIQHRIFLAAVATASFLQPVCADKVWTKYDSGSSSNGGDRSLENSLPPTPFLTTTMTTVIPPPSLENSLPPTPFPTTTTTTVIPPTPTLEPTDVVPTPLPTMIIRSPTLNRMELVPSPSPTMVNTYSYTPPADSVPTPSPTMVFTSYAYIQTDAVPTPFPTMTIKTPTIKPTDQVTTSPTAMDPMPTPFPTVRSPTHKPVVTCCDSTALRQTILANVYRSADASIFNSGPQKEAIAWLVKDTCECEQFCSNKRVVQRYILAVLYYSTQGDNWESCSAPANMQDKDACQVQSDYGSNIIQLPDKENVSVGFKWLTCSSECDWAGTLCNRNDELNAIDIENNGLAGQLPSEIGGLPKLTALALQQNEIGGTLFDMSGLTELRQLKLYRNNLEGTIKGLGWENTKLQVLNLSYNQFTGLIAPEIGDLTNLISVQLQCNELETQVFWANCPAVVFFVDEYICDANYITCPCTKSFKAPECAANIRYSNALMR